MQFDHEKLDVYQASLKFAGQSTKLVEALPPGKAYLADQLNRATLSICLNIGEGAGEYSRNDKARFYRMSKRSATECAAVVDVCRTLALGRPEQLDECRATLVSIVSMLIKLIKAITKA